MTIKTIRTIQSQETQHLTLRIQVSLFDNVMDKSFIFPDGEFERGEITRAFVECIEIGVEARDRD